MKQLLQLACIIVFTLTCGVVSTGCKTVNPPTAEAIRYNTLRSTWTIALATHDVYSEMVVLNKVKPADQADIDKAFEDFKSAFKVAALLAESNLAAPTPENLQKLADDLVTLIRSL